MQTNIDREKSLKPGRELVVVAARHAEVLAQPAPPAPGRGEAAVRTLRTLVSPGTELSIYGGTHIGLRDPRQTWMKYPFRPGYAAIGEVTAVGEPDADGWPLPRVGDRVFFFGRHASWNVLRAGGVWLCPPADLDSDAVLLARLVQISATVVTGLRRSPRSAVVVGAGLIGLFAAQFLQARGCARVVVQDVVPERLTLARRNGLPDVVLARGEGLDAALDLLGGGRPDLVVEATGIAALIAPCLAAVATHGDVVLLGIPRAEATLNLYDLLVTKNAALIGAHEGRIPERDATPGAVTRQSLIEEAMVGIRRGAIRVEGLIGEVARPDDLPAVYERLLANRAGGLTAAIDWT